VSGKGKNKKNELLISGVWKRSIVAEWNDILEKSYNPITRIGI